MNELQLPNPGNNRYWDIGVNSLADYVITLRDQKGKFLVDSTIYKENASQATFTEAANRLMIEAQNEAVFVGQYKFEETN